MNIINNQPIVNYKLRNNNLSNKPLSMPKLQNSLDKVSFKGNEKLEFIWKLSEAEKKILKYKMKNVSVDEIANLVHQDKSLKLLHDDLKQTNANVGIVYKTYNNIETSFGEKSDATKKQLIRTGLVPDGARIPLIGLPYTLGEALTDQLAKHVTIRKHIPPEKYANVCFAMEDLHNAHIQEYFDNGVQKIHENFQEKTNNIGLVVPNLVPAMEKQQVAEQKAFEKLKIKNEEIINKVDKNITEVFDEYASNLYLRLFTKVITLGIL